MYLFSLFALTLNSNQYSNDIDLNQNNDIFSSSVQKISGIDERYRTKFFDIEDTELKNFRINYEKTNIKNQLQSNYIHNYDKLEIINKFEILEINKKFDDLIEDWEFSM